MSVQTVEPTTAAQGVEEVTFSSQSRWVSLDSLKAVALFAMVAHHFASWTGGHVRERWIGFDGFVVTDLAAPIFAVTMGAGAYLVGAGLAAKGRPVADVASALWRWSVIALVGVAIDIANGSWVDGGGVLYTLAALGAAITLVVTYGLHHRWVWWGIAGTAAVCAGPVLHEVTTPTGVFPRLWTGQFALVTYLVFAAIGAAVVAHVGSRGEGALPLVRAAAAVVAFGTVMAIVLPASAPEGLWPPTRYPGDLAFTVWGSAASLALWAGLRAVVPHDRAITAALTRAGRRTLWVFGLHFALRVALQETGHLRLLTTWRWGLASWGAVALICALAASDLPQRVRRRRAPVT